MKLNEPLPFNWKMFIGIRGENSIETRKEYLRKLEGDLGGKPGVIALFTLLQEQIIAEMVQYGLKD